MANYGMAVSQRGYDVKDCPDRFLAYSSSFQNLKIFQRYTVTGTIPTGGAAPITLTLNHALGYIAPFIVMYNGRTNRGFARSYYMYAPGEPFLYENIRQYANNLRIENIWDDFDDGVPGETIQFTVYLLLDDFRSISEEIINTTGSSGAAGGDYGIRISKDGFDVLTASDDELVFSSSFFTAIVNIKGTAAAGHAEIAHTLGYVPDYLAFVKESGDSYARMLISEEEQGIASLFGWRCNAEDDKLDMGYWDGASWTLGHTFYYVIFKQRTDG